MKNKWFLLPLALFAFPAHALNVQNHRYHFHGGRADTLVESSPKPKDTLTLGFGTSIAAQPLEFGSSVGAAPRNIVDYALTFDFGASYSFSDRVALALNLPAHVTGNIRSLTNFTKESVLSFGDMGLSGLYRFVSREDNAQGLGFGVAPFLTFPTGVNSNFVGDAGVTAGFLLAGDWERDGNYVGLNLGLRLRQEENILNLRVAHEFLYALAYHRPVWEAQDLSAFAEASGSTVLADFWQRANSSPIEVKLGVSKIFLPDTPITVKLVNGIGIGNGYGNPDYRATLQVTYDHLLPRTKVIEKTVTVERIEKVEQRLKELTIYYPTDGAQVDPFYDEKIAGIAQVLKDNPDLGPLYIIGHTDDVGSDAYNRRLSEKRARQAYDSILQYGLAPKDVIWFGVGETEHVAPNDSDANRALNRRTVFTFQKPRQISEKEGGVVPAPDSTGVPASDSYTETLKRQKEEGFVDDEPVEPVKTRTEVRVKEETKVIRGGEGEDEGSSSSRRDIKGKTFKSRKKKSDYQEKDLGGDENFDEPFAE